MPATSHGRAWVDLLTPKQILFFGPVIRALEAAGFEVLATSRRYRELGPLVERAGLDVKFIGERGSRGPVEQLVASTKRQQEIIPLVKDFGPSIAVSVASSVCARVAFGLGVKHVSVNDSPHSEVAGRLSVPLSYHLMCPWVIPYEAWSKFGMARPNITRYHALDPAVWLKRSPMAGPVPELDEAKKTITVRVQESDAPYLSGADISWTDALLGALIKEFPDVNMVALCRYDYQVQEIRSKFGEKCLVPDEPVSGHDLLAATDLFIGMGGTMSAEAALMGVPAISAFQGVLFTDSYLQSVGLLGRALKPEKLVSLARRFIEDRFRMNFEKKAARVLASMEDPVPRIVDQLSKTAGQG